MDTNTTPNPTPFNPQDSLLPVEPIEAVVPAQVRPQRTAGEFKRFKLIAVSAAIAGLAATGGLAAMAPAATPATDTSQTAAAAPQVPANPTPTTNVGTNPGFNGAQPPQRGPGGPGHATTGGS